MPVIKDIANAIKDSLNGGSFSLPFTAVVDYLPDYSLPELATLRVTVVPSGLDTELVSRSHDANEYSVSVGVQQKLDDDDVTVPDVDALLDLVKQISDHLKRKSQANVSWIRTKNAPFLDPERLRSSNQFTSILTFTYRATSAA